MTVLRLGTTSDPFLRSPRLEAFARAGVLAGFDLHLAASVARLAPATSDTDLLALALAARATRLGHVCMDLDEIRSHVVTEGVESDVVDALPWPSVAAWQGDLCTSPIVAGPDSAAVGIRRPLVLDGRRLYLQRYWSYEVGVADQLIRRSRAVDDAPAGPWSHAHDPQRRAQVLDQLFGAPDPHDLDLQMQAADRALRLPVTIVAGGPGTGKTHTIARIIVAAVLLAEGTGYRLRVALAAPTGKAAMRMGIAVRGELTELVKRGMIGPESAAVIEAVEPSTLHRLLLAGPWRSGGDDGTRRLPFDLVIVDETSMVALPLMARLLDALADESRLVLVGDPYQLASIESGTVMNDVVGPGAGAGKGVEDAPLAGRVTVLERQHRFGAESGTATLARAVRDGEVDQVLEVLSGSSAEVRWVLPEDRGALDEVEDEVITAAAAIASAAVDGDAEQALRAAEQVKVLAAVRSGPLGRSAWGDRIESAVEQLLPRVPRLGRVRVGTPIIVTGNDKPNGLFNGDVGVLVQTPDGPRAAIRTGSGHRLLPLSRLGKWEEWWAMTIHKSQGSEFPHTIVSLPTVDSPILTRELLYTAVTRAKPGVTVVGSEASIRLAIARPVARASGLRDRLWPGV
jgi:exodeoxyribonuclease V alpha subunit